MGTIQLVLNKTNIHLSDVRNYSNRYDSHATSISAEVGYGFILHEKDSYGVLPFVEANWLYDSSTPEAKINTTHVKSDISKNQFEAKLGLNGNFSKALSGYAHVNGRFGSNSHSNVGAKIGLNYSF